MASIEMTSDILTARVMELYEMISQLDSLRPSKQVNALFTELVELCVLPSSANVKDLPHNLQTKRENLIVLAGKAEGLLELEFSTFLAQTPNAMKNLNLFPYYKNYLKLAALEHGILSRNGVSSPKRVAFVGSGPMPLTSLVLAMNHMKSTHFDNYDFDAKANALARQIVSTDTELEKRMRFETRDVMEIREKLAEYDCIFLAALVGMRIEDKVRVLGHMRKYMKEGGFLLVRSAKGARAFLYPVVEECDLVGFQVLDVVHPTNEVVNSVILVKKPLC